MLSDPREFAFQWSSSPSQHCSIQVWFISWWENYWNSRTRNPSNVVHFWQSCYRSTRSCWWGLTIPWGGASWSWSTTLFDSSRGAYTKNSTMPARISPNTSSRSSKSKDRKYTAKKSTGSSTTTKSSHLHHLCSSSQSPISNKNILITDLSLF